MEIAVITLTDIVSQQIVMCRQLSIVKWNQYNNYIYLPPFIKKLLDPSFQLSKSIAIVIKKNA